MEKYPEVYVEGSQIYYNDSKNNLEILIGEEIPMEHLWEYVETEEVEATLNFNFKGRTKSLTLKRSDYMSNEGLKELISRGAPINTKFKSIYPLYFANVEEIAEIRYKHKYIGFDYIKGMFVFKAHKCIGHDSIYDGGLAIEPRGSLTAWKGVVEQEVLGNVYLELAVAIGLSSALVGFIGDTLALDSPIVHISGNSTTGKSTAAKLAVSVWGYTDTKKDGLMTTYNATKNALLSKLNYNYGMTMCFDELSMSSAKSYTDFVYKLANGRDKDRLNQDATRKETGNWLTTIISTGELSILEKCAQNIGLKVRVIEIKDRMLTKNAENSDNIKKVISENYGHAGVEFARYLLGIGQERVTEMYLKLSNIISDEMKKRGMNDQFIDRRVSKLTLFVLSAKLAMTSLGIQLNPSRILKELISLEKEAMSERQLGKNAYSYFINQVFSNKQRFNRRNERTGMDVSAKLSPSWGTIIYLEDESIEIEVPVDRFNEILKMGEFESPKTILSEWKKNDLLDCEKDRTTRKRKVGYSELTNVCVVKYREVA